MNRLKSLLFAGAVMIASCGDRPESHTAASEFSQAKHQPLPTGDSSGISDLPKLGCFSTDSLAADDLAFGAIEISPEDEDASGVQFAFRYSGGRVQGTVRNARGEVPPERALLDLNYDSAADTLSFWYGEITRYYYRFRPRCTELSGVARLFVTDANRTGQLVTQTVPRAPRIRQP